MLYLFHEFNSLFQLKSKRCFIIYPTVWFYELSSENKGDIFLERVLKRYTGMKKIIRQIEVKFD